MTSKFRNKQLYTDIFPLSRSSLIGTEYQYTQASQPLIQKIKQQFGESQIPNKAFSKPKQYASPKKTIIPTTSTTSNIMSQYDSSLHQKIPKSDLELPLQIALKMTYPEQIAKYKEEAKRYGYYIDPLTDEEHLVLHNPSKKAVIFGVRGTNVMNTQDILTDVESAFINIKKFDRYKKAQDKYRQVKSKFDDIPIIHASHSLGGLISSVLAQPEDFIYSYNRPYFSYPVRKNEVAISVESDPLRLTRWKNQGNQPVIIPRTYYEKSKDYVAIQKTKINPEFEEKPFDIPEKFKNDLPNVAYENVLKGAFPLFHFAKTIYSKYIARPEVYRQQLIANLQQQATEAQTRMERVSARILPRTSSTSPRTITRLQEAISRPLTAIEQNVLNPTILDTTRRAIQQMVRDPSNAFYDVLGHPLLGYAVANYAGGYLSRKASNSHAIENLPLNIRINTKYIEQPDYGF
jgi:hypothetical protein